MTNKTETLKHNKIKKVNGGWGPAKKINNPFKKDLNDPLFLSEQWDFSYDEIKKLKSQGYKIHKGMNGFVAINNIGRLCYYNYITDKQQIERILGEEKIED